MTGTATHDATRWKRTVADLRRGTGPTLVCVGGLHGNEPSGLLAAERIAAWLETSDAWRGRFVAIAGHLGALNEPGHARRYFSRDINRLFRSGVIRAARDRSPADLDPEDVELLALVEVLGRVASESSGETVVADLHTFSSPSPAFVYVEDSLPARRLGLALGLPLVLGLEEELDGLLVDFTTNTLGLRSLLVEAGTHADPASIDGHEAAIRLIAREIGILDDPGEVDGRACADVLIGAAGGRAGRVYDVRRREPIGDPPLEMLERAQAFTRVWKNMTPVARRGEERVLAPADGLLFMPNRQSVRRAPDDAFFVIRRVWRRLMWLSAWLRSRPVAHRVLAWLPGVARDPCDRDALVVDPKVAAILTRDVLHLLGYRVRTGSPIPYRRLHIRLLVAPYVLARAAAACLLPARGAPNRGASGRVWRARRRRLDVHPPSGMG